MTPTEALEAWGAYDRDRPFSLFAAVLEQGTVQPVTLADGHDAWLVIGYDEARIALNDARLSKDMHAAMASGEGIVAEGLPHEGTKPDAFTAGEHHRPAAPAVQGVRFGKHQTGNPGVCRLRHLLLLSRRILDSLGCA